MWLIATASTNQNHWPNVKLDVWIDILNGPLEQRCCGAVALKRAPWADVAVPDTITLEYGPHAVPKKWHRKREVSAVSASKPLRKIAKN